MTPKLLADKHRGVSERPLRSEGWQQTARPSLDSLARTAPWVDSARSPPRAATSPVLRIAVIGIAQRDRGYAEPFDLS